MTQRAGETAIRALITTIDQAHRNRDAAAIVAPYSPDAVLFDLAPPLARPVTRDDVAAWLDTWEGPVTRESRDFDITVDGDLAVARGYFRTSAITKQGGERAEWWSRATLCLQRKDGGWKIMHEHTSVPFYMDGSFRAALDLKP